MDPDITDDLTPSRFKRGVSKTFYSLRTRNFRLYFSGQLISNTGNWLTNIALTLLVLHTTGSGVAVGLLAACQYGPILFLSAYAGAIADRSNKRLLLIVTQTLEMAESAGLAVLAFLPHPPIVGLFILALAGGIFLAFDNPLRRSFVSEMVPKEDIPNAVVLYSTIVNTSRIFGPALAGLLVVTVGYAWCFAIDAASYLAVLFCLVRMNPKELHRQASKPRTKGEVRAGLKYVLKTPELMISFAMLAVIGTLTYNFNITLPLFVTRSLHGSVGSYTILYSTFSVGAVISGLIVAQRSMVRIRHVIYGAMALGIASLLVAITPSIGLALPAIFLLGAASILYTNATTTLAQVDARPDMLGRVLALQTVLLVGPTAIGGPILGWIADELGGRSPIIIGGLVAIAVAIVGFMAVGRLAPGSAAQN
jgi:MFS family permease